MSRQQDIFYTALYIKGVQAGTKRTLSLPASASASLEHKEHDDLWAPESLYTCSNTFRMQPILVYFEPGLCLCVM
jgi:hypothetical protein